ncbi:TraR/DksA family transcriptional regulator [Humisphaera borealis]|uniref:DksA C4-type domain-containing protein n=1 Tax=Humisphaera borealis TaxID=2807512 RepID=A0A7M2X3D8_9BACT|nr:hypothetical protein [Humisphaera borealis]QOV92195.1 hypothetical protein IPV69_12905 [Humisphaera borealis]
MKPAKSAKPVAAKAANGKQVPVKAAPAKTVPVKAVPAKPAAAKSAPSKSGPVKPAAAAPASAKSVVAKPAAVKAAPQAPQAAAKPVAADKPAGDKPVAKAPAKSAAKAKMVMPPVKTIILPARPAGSPPVVVKPPVAAPAAVKSKDKTPRIETKPEPFRPMNILEQANSSGDSKPKKNQAGLSVKELEFFRDLLLAKRRELVGDMSSMEREALQSGDSGLSTLPIHMADMGTDNYEQEFTLGLVEKDRVLLREINHALAKVQNGSYGVCEGNGKPISKVRLEAQPWARFSIEFARLQEKGPIRR